MESEILDDDIIIRIPRKFYNGYIKDLADAIEYKKIVSRSKAKQKDIDELLAQIKKERRPFVKQLLDKIEVANSENISK